MNGMDARTLSLPTEFLQRGKKYVVTLYEDDPDLDTRTKGCHQAKDHQRRPVPQTRIASFRRGGHGNRKSPIRSIHFLPILKTGDAVLGIPGIFVLVTLVNVPQPSYHLQCKFPDG